MIRSIDLQIFNETVWKHNHYSIKKLCIIMISRFTSTGIIGLFQGNSKPEPPFSLMAKPRVSGWECPNQTNSNPFIIIVIDRISIFDTQIYLHHQFHEFGHLRTISKSNFTIPVHSFCTFRLQVGGHGAAEQQRPAATVVFFWLFNCSNQNVVIII